MKTVNLKEGMPLVRQALMQMERELAMARARGLWSGQADSWLWLDGRGRRNSDCGAETVAGDERGRTDSRRHLRRGLGEVGRAGLEDRAALSKELKLDRDLGKGNRGITIVEL